MCFYHYHVKKMCGTLQLLAAVFHYDCFCCFNAKLEYVLNNTLGGSSYSTTTNRVSAFVVLTGKPGWLGYVLWWAQLEACRLDLTVIHQPKRVLVTVRHSLTIQLDFSKGPVLNKEKQNTVQTILTMWSPIHPQGLQVCFYLNISHNLYVDFHILRCRQGWLTDGTILSTV